MLSMSQIRVIDPVLSNVALGYKNPEFVGSALFPRVPVRVSGGNVLTFDKAAFRAYNLTRSPGSAIPRIQFGYSGTTFALVNCGVAAVVPFEHMRDAAVSPGIDLGTRATNLAMRAVTLNLEIAQATLATTAGNYGASYRVALTGVAKWSDPVSDPIAAILGYMETVRTATGAYPNTMVLSAVAFKAIRSNPQVIARFVGTDKATRSVTAQMIAELLDLRQVVVGKAVYANAADTFVDVWGNNAVLAYVPENPSGMEEPSYGYTYTMEGHPAVGISWMDRNTESWLFPMAYERVPVLSGITSGFLIQNPN